MFGVPVFGVFAFGVLAFGVPVFEVLIFGVLVPGPGPLFKTMLAHYCFQQSINLKFSVLLKIISCFQINENFLDTFCGSIYRKTFDSIVS